jgi:hypothetical protein
VKECAAVIALALTGCAADLGAGVGAIVPSGNAVGIGRLAVSTRVSDPLNSSGFLVGGSVETRGEANVGARFSAGLSVGYGDGPPLLGSRVGWELFADFGTPLEGKLFGNTRFYAGATGALPIRLDAGRPLRDLNDSTWIVKRRIEVVPFLRGRVHYETGVGTPPTEIAGGVSLRLRWFSDLF